jgi:hypothetical protein
MALWLFARNVDLLRGRLIAVLEAGDCRQGQFVGNARIVDV